MTIDRPPGDRIAKVMAQRGLGSRREIERWIEAGRVSVNGQKITSPALNVTEADRILLDGKLLPTQPELKVWRFHKPRGVLTTRRDPQGRPILFDLLPKGFPHVLTIGRLDMDSEGLILLTNLGTVAHHLESPKTGWIRTYRVRVHGRVSPQDLNKLAEGLTIDGIHYKSIQATLDNQAGGNAWLTMKITEGKNREIRRVCEDLGWSVNRLIRTGYGPFTLGELPKSGLEEVPTRILKNFLGKAFFTC